MNARERGRDRSRGSRCLRLALLAVVALVAAFAAHRSLAPTVATTTDSSDPNCDRIVHALEDALRRELALRAPPARIPLASICRAELLQLLVATQGGPLEPLLGMSSNEDEEDPDALGALRFAVAALARWRAASTDARRALERALAGVRDNSSLKGATFFFHCFFSTLTF